MTPPPAASRRSAAAALVVGAVLVVVFLLVRHSPTAEAVVYQGASFGALAAIATRFRGRRRSGPVCLFAAGVAAYAAGDLLWALHNLLGVALPSAYLPDAAYLACYPLLGAALVGFAAARREPTETVVRQLVDAALLFVAGFTVLWFVALQPRVLGGGNVVDSVLSVAYPTLDLALVTLAARGALSSNRWPTSYVLLTGGFVFMFAGDLTWRILLVHGGYVPSSWINVLFMVGYVLWAAALLHPSFDAVTGITRAALAPTSAWRRLSFLLVAAGIPAAVMVSGVEVDTSSGTYIFGAAITLVPILGLARVADVFRSLHALAAQAEAARAELGAVLEHSPVAIAVVDGAGIVRAWNDAAATVSGWRAEDVVGAPTPIELLGAEATAGLLPRRVEVTTRRRDGHELELRVSSAPLQTEDGRVVVLFEDVTLERAQAAQIEFLTGFDPLTGLPNRRRFELELESAAIAAAAGVPVQVALLDLDAFKTINDTAGHLVGDRILHDVATLIRSSVRAGDFVARASGDEFGAIFWGMDVGGAADAVERVAVEVRDYRLRHGRETHDVTVSAGVYTLGAEDSPASALRRVDEALNRAKKHGRNRIQVWGEDIPSAGSDRAWSVLLKDALREGRIDLHAQPIVALRDSSVVFHEALARVRRPDRTVVPACEWIDAAERLGLMPEIDVRMLENAEAAVRAWPGLRIFVNLSASSFHDQRVLARLEQALDSVPRGALGVEITEHTTLTDRDRTATLLTRLQALGAPIAIDDFGLGFTSFGELAGLPCDLIKIPGEFARDRGDLTIAGAIASVAHHYGKRVVIEGVEDAQLALSAAALGIELAQGWHYGRPEPLTLRRAPLRAVEDAA